MSKQNKTDKKKLNPIIWFIFAVIVPLVVIITITVVILSMAGVNVIDWTKDKLAHIPGASTLVSSNEDEKKQVDTDKSQSQVTQREKEIKELNQQVDDLKTINNRLEQKIVKLEKNTSNPSMEEDSKESTMVETMSQSFKGMDRQQAALILTDLEIDTAVSLLKELSNKVRGEILGEMEPAKAAELTQKLINDNS
ncbi:hypothetical protein GLV94_09910 [Virgibacillus halodenitrificans]|jgi:flagellar protein FlbB|uniref:Magnesium transporter MgtE intracellular domain-containing protein n=1 Tax=Virgibacillus halodenitrificans TaxID=1482 RepID=A0AAC9J0I7_VIRHA|nr:hypothetical protein [Virgibacillus halodenitrificans]APC48630.1 hypothetical protein BME96_10740 [Virgibacillus halodenitrificans]MBD1224167.1 hypothetical protein [Virgibacillus halodenitrificans]MCG1028703.1 hypothetical protein [Virgibacillus halodenitrificans]MCJ0931204.1 hypothetical protein [Virgibacillus halodenitrificans]MYL45964.1 hypothetical protein [Virgibacillus halodenitrificans]